MKHSRNSQQIQGDFQDFEAPAPAEPEYAGEVTMALPPVPMPDPNARRGLAPPGAHRPGGWGGGGVLGAGGGARRLPFGVEVALGYLAAKEAEWTAVRTVLSGRMAGVPAEALRERLREQYV